MQNDRTTGAAHNRSGTGGSTRTGGAPGSGTGSGTGAGTGSTTGAAGASVVDQAKDTAQQLMGQAHQQAKAQVQTGVSRSKGRAADSLRGVARSLRTSGEQLRSQDQGNVPANVSGYVDQAAERVEQLADYVQNTDVAEMLDGVERFARREPAIFLGGAFAIGLLGSRFLKSSRRNDRRASGADNRRLPMERDVRFGAGSGASFGDREVTARTIPAETPADRAPFPDSTNDFGTIGA